MNLQCTKRLMNAIRQNDTPSVHAYLRLWIWQRSQHSTLNVFRHNSQQCHSHCTIGMLSIIGEKFALSSDLSFRCSFLGKDSEPTSFAPTFDGSRQLLPPPAVVKIQPIRSHQNDDGQANRLAEKMLSKCEACSLLPYL